MTPHPPVLEVRDLRVHFRVRRGTFSRVSGTVRAVDGVSFALRRGETIGLVGESGCGKTTMGRALLRLVKPTSGDVLFDGKSVLALEGGELRTFRRRAQMVFQDPYGSLNPRMTVGDMLREVLHVHGLARDSGPPRERAFAWGEGPGPPRERRFAWRKGDSGAEARVRHLLDRVGLLPAHSDRYPHEFSGGQRQRIAIARALAVEPELLVCDEPVSALDVSVRAQVINLLKDLQGELGLTYLFIAHDLALVEHVSDRVAVMYLGRIVETAPARELYRDPKHPYTQALLSAVPTAGVARLGTGRIVLVGDVPSPVRPPPGCAFFPRCPNRAKDQECRAAVPPLEEKAPGHLAACVKVVSARESGHR